MTDTKYMHRQTIADAKQALAVDNQAKAVSICKSLLKNNREDHEAWHLLAMILAGQGDLASAEQHITAALRITEHWTYWRDYARLLNSMQRVDDALAGYKRALKVAPFNAELFLEYAQALYATGNQPMVARVIEKITEVAPNHPHFQNFRGVVLLDEGRHSEAEVAFRQAIRLDPEYVEAHYNLGVLLLHQSRWSEAEAEIRCVIEKSPNLSEAHNNLGVILKSRGAAETALSAFEQAVQLRPGNLQALSNLAEMHWEIKDYQGAEKLYRQIKSISPDNSQAMAGLAYVLAQTCSWPDMVNIEHELIRELNASQLSTASPFHLLRIGEVTPAMQRAASLSYVVSQRRARYACLPKLLAKHDPVESRRLRLGYLSADIHEHATMHLLGGVLDAHDRESFEIWIYSYGKSRKDSSRQRAVNAVEHFVECSDMTDGEIAERIADDRIDILVDLKGFTRDARIGILMMRPAPLIINWLGYPGTMGDASLADYIIGDPVVTPEAHIDHFSESIAQMPHCYQPNDRTRVIGARPDRQSVGLPEGAFVFCSFNQAYKIGPEMFDTWCALLREVPDSVLWLLDHGQIVRENLIQEAAARHVDGKRLIFAQMCPAAEHLARLSLADLALDTYPYTSHTTGSDALWAGVPLVTRMGESFASRVAASLLHAVGLPELVTTSQDAYFELAKALALDSRRLRDIRELLQNNRNVAPLFDTQRFTRDLEALYQCIQVAGSKPRRAILAGQ